MDRRGWVPFLILCAGALALWPLRGALTAEGIAARSPRQAWLAAAFLLALYAVKSLSVAFPLSALEAAGGMLFPLPTALAVNACGVAVAQAVPYLPPSQQIGHRLRRGRGPGGALAAGPAAAGRPGGAAGAIPRVGGTGAAGGERGRQGGVSAAAGRRLPRGSGEHVPGGGRGPLAGLFRRRTAGQPAPGGLRHPAGDGAVGDRGRPFLAFSRGRGAADGGLLGAVEGLAPGLRNPFF